jgi:hypothetical protein
LAIPTIDFRNIRPHRGSQATGFEELTRQLVLAEALPQGALIEHRGPGADGGVEVLVRFPDGPSWGWQSKFWLDGFGESQVQQAKQSFESALDHYGPDNKGRLTTNARMAQRNVVDRLRQRVGAARGRRVAVGAVRTGYGLASDVCSNGSTPETKADLPKTLSHRVRNGSGTVLIV